MNRSSRRAPARKRHTVAHVSGPLISHDEKRSLILAHHEARQRSKPHPGWGVGYYVGIAASCLVILTGWWMTLGTNLRRGLPGQDDAGAIVESNFNQLRQQLGDVQALEEAKEQIHLNLEKIKMEYEAQQAQQNNSTSTKS